MLDERWDDELLPLAEGLRKVLGRECTPDHVRAFEGGTSTDGLEAALAGFGLWELPDDAAVRVVTAWELGRSLAPVDIDRLVADPDDGRFDRLRWLLDAARLVGASEGLLAIGVDYAKQRQQFGRAIGAFQAVAHRLADAATAVDGAGLLVRKATWIADQAPDRSPTWTFARMARWKAAQAGRLTATHVHQVMGGYGFAMEYDCQLFSRRIRRWSSRLGRPEDALEEIGRDVADADRRAEVQWLWHHEAGMPLPRWAVEADGG